MPCCLPHCLVSALQLPFIEVESVEFARQGGCVVSSRTFDLVVRMKNDVEHQFRFVWGESVKGHSGITPLHT